MSAARLGLPLAALLSVGAPTDPEKPIASIDLARPFGTRAPWRFTAAQGSDIADPVHPDEKAPGAIQLCVSADAGRSCRPDLARLLALPGNDDLFAVPHYLAAARIVRPRSGGRLLLLQVASLHSGDGDQRRATAVLAYDRAQDRFESVYVKQTGRNNDQEIRYIAGGPLDGAIVSAEPTGNAPFGFWVTVNRRAAGGYRPILRYRSATRYGDGNPLAVIDSEMPGIRRRLGLWRPGAPLPLPQRRCAHPHLVRGALWC